MRFGVCIPHHRAIMPIDAVMAAPERAEALGYDSVWVNDHIVIPDELLDRGYTPAYYEPFIIMAAAAARTAHVKVGSTIIVLPYRNPVIQAKMLATLDAMSGGRVIFGIGAGWMEAEFRALGVPFAERGPRTDEALQVLLELWTADAPSFAGRYFSFSDVQFAPKPVQQPRIPLWIGGTGRAALRRAAQFGDAWHPNLTSLDALSIGIARLKQEWQRFGRAGEPVVTLRLSGAGFEPEARDEPRRLGHGTPAQVIADLDAVRRLGIDYVVLDFVQSVEMTEQEWHTALESFSRTVLPQFT